MDETQTIEVRTSDDYYRLKMLVAERDKYKKALVRIQDVCFGSSSQSEVEHFAYNTSKAALDA